MFDHIGFVTADLEQSRQLYTCCLEPLGIKLIEDNSMPGGSGWLVFGTAADAPFFVVASSAPSFWADSHSPGNSPIHFAFSAPNRKAVDQFYNAGLKTGGRDNGSPGKRDASYYAAYLIDLDGNNVEAGYRGLA
ncbi:MAG: VOC family protein [Cyanobacteria bacterium P01_D01_bin.56]